MNYIAAVTAVKVMSRVVVWGEVRRLSQTDYVGTVVWSKSVVFDEEAHPEPEKWLREHIAAFLETL